MAQKTGSMPALDAEHEDNHPDLRTYVWIAIFLAIVTAVEVAIYYIPAFEGVLVPALLILSAVKFLYVVAFPHSDGIDQRRMSLGVLEVNARFMLH